MRRLRLLVALVLVALLLAAPGAAGQSGDTAVITEVGWWSQRPGAAPAPEGGFEVATGVGGDQSVAALAVTTAGSLQSATLVLDEVGGRAQDSAALQVCPVTRDWVAANPGPFAEAPTFDCDAGSATLGRDAAAARWRGDVTSLLAAGATGLMVVPAGAAGPLPVTIGFEVRFAGARLEVEAAAEVDEATPPPSGTPTGDTSSTDGGSPASSPPVGQADGSGSFNEASPSAGPPAALAATPDPHPSDPVPATEAAAPAVTESLAGGIGASPGALLPADLSAASHGGAPWARLFALVPLCAAVGAGSAYGRRYVLARG